MQIYHKFERISCSSSKYTTILIYYNFTKNEIRKKMESNKKIYYKFMNLSQGIITLLATFSASLEHDDVGLSPSFDAAFLVHKKKFRDPSAISFSSLSKPAPHHTEKLLGINLKKINITDLTASYFLSDGSLHLTF